MPVQDITKAKTEVEFFDNDEDKRRQAMQDSQENSVLKSQKLLPFLNAKAEFHQSRMDSINDMITGCENKIAKNEAKIEHLTAKADRLEDRNTMLKNTLGNIPVVRKLIERNEERIDTIRNEKIPKRQENIGKHKQKIRQLTDKRDRIGHKLDRVLALNDAVNSFSISFNKERREVFTDAMDRLNSANSECLVDKISKCQEQKQQLIAEYSDPETSVVDKVKLSAKLKAVDDKLKDLGNKLHKLARPENHFAEQTNNVVDATMQATADAIAAASMSFDMGMTDLAETIFLSADKVEGLDKSIIADMAYKFNHLKNVEIEVEDDANSIDGIINNGSKEELLQTRKELAETLDAIKEIAGTKHMMLSVREGVAKDIPKIEAQIAAVNKALGEMDSRDDPLESIPRDSKDGITKINNDYYHSLPRSDRHIETMAVPQAEAVMKTLARAEVKFSAVIHGEDKASITVSKGDSPKMKEVMKQAVEEIKPETPKKEVSQKSINPDYSKSLDKSDRVTHIETKDVADKVMSQLDSKNIPYSAVERKNGCTAITISQDDEKAYNNISNFIKDNRAVEFVNPDFYSSLPKEQRSTQSMTQEQAVNKIAELAEKGIEHSAVLNGGKSAVTVAKKDEETAFFSRDKLRKSAERISNQKKPDVQKNKTKDQGIE